MPYRKVVISMKEYYNATSGTDFRVDSRGMFHCGCGSEHVFVAGTTDAIMWKGMGNTFIVWYVRCALDHMIWRALME